MPASKNPELSKQYGGGYGWLVANKDYAGDDCLTWPFSVAHSGYGRIGHLGKIWTTQRLMCVIAHGEPPTPDHVAAHNCGNGHLACCNPRHLEWKTQSENQHDRKAQRRRENGAGGSRTRLAREVIEEIRRTKATESIPQIAARLGVGRGTVEYWRSTTHDPAPPGKARQRAAA